MNKTLYPLKLSPVCKEIIWGGNRLKNEYNISSDLANVAEAWTLTCRKDGDNIIENGPCKGMTLSQYLEPSEKFPLLIKLIDACDKLSIQVHPEDEYSLKNEGELGKTEVWYIVDATPGATLVWGLKEYDKEAFIAAAKDGTLEKYMNYVPVNKGDVYFIPSGCVHAIGAGILIAEIQQSSNVTYRVYDYNRPGKDGKPRETHLEKALDVIVDWKPEDIDSARFSEGKSENAIVNCKYFKVDRYEIKDSVTLCASEGFVHILCLDGEGTINGETIIKGDSWFLPKGLCDVKIEGKLEIVASQAK